MIQLIALIIITAGIYFSSIKVNAQPRTWLKVLDNRDGVLNKIIETPDRNFVAVGSEYFPINRKIYMIKVNIYGDTIWKKLLYNVDNFQYDGNDIENIFPQGYIIAGSNSKGIGSDAYIIKTDTFGVKIWDELYGGNAIDVGASVMQTVDKGFIMLCRTTNDIYNNMMLIKTDSLGNLQWQKVYLYNNQQIPRELQLADSSGYIFLGFGFNDMFLIRTDFNGDTVWTRRYGGNNLDEGRSICKSSKGGYILAGTSKSYNPQSYQQSYVVKIDSEGIIVWERTYSKIFNEICYSITEVPNIGYVFCGTTDSTFENYERAFIRVIDYDGNILHEKSYRALPYFTEFKSVGITSDGGFILCGVTQQLSGSQPKMVIAKTDSACNIGSTKINQINTTVPDNFKLIQNFPNPFNSQTKIQFYLNVRGNINFSIYDISGKQIVLLKSMHGIPGKYEINFDASDYQLGSGVYFYEIQFYSSNIFHSQKKKMVYLK